MYYDVILSTEYTFSYQSSASEYYLLNWTRSELKKLDDNMQHATCNFIKQNGGYRAYRAPVDSLHEADHMTDALILISNPLEIMFSFR